MSKSKTKAAVAAVKKATKGFEKLDAATKTPSRPPLDQPNRVTIERLFKELAHQKSRAGRILADAEWKAHCKAESLAKRILAGHREYQRLRRIQDRLSKSYANHENPITADAKQLRLRYLANGITPEIVAALNQLLDRSDDGTKAAKKLVASLGIE